jgi:hypothetical protein
VFGQQSLFGGHYEGQGRPLRFTVSITGQRGQVTTTLALAVARARAVAVNGGRAVITANDGSGVAVGLDGSGFVVTGSPSTPWDNQVRRLLAEHG